MPAFESRRWGRTPNLRNTADIRKILVLQLCPIGDTLFGTPAVRALRAGFPAAEIVDLCWTSNAAVMDGNPHIDRLLKAKGTAGLQRHLIQLQEEDFDLVVGLSHLGSYLSVTFPRAFRVGFVSQTLGWAYYRNVPDRRNQHAVDYCLDVVRAVGVQPRGRHMEIFPSRADVEAAERFMAQVDVGSAAVVAMHPGGQHYQMKRWPVEGFAAAADALLARGIAVILVGGREDRSLARDIMALMRRQPLDATGRLSLKETAALISKCDVFVGNDSAPLHLASAVGTPTVALFGPSDPANFAPLNPEDIVIRHQMACAPCLHWLDGPTHYLGRLAPRCQRECMRAITPLEVTKAVLAQLERRSVRRVEASSS